MGAGIAVHFKERFKRVGELKAQGEGCTGMGGGKGAWRGFDHTPLFCRCYNRGCGHAGGEGAIYLLPGEL